MEAHNNVISGNDRMAKNQSQQLSHLISKASYLSTGGYIAVSATGSHGPLLPRNIMYNKWNGENQRSRIFIGSP